MTQNAKLWRNNLALCTKKWPLPLREMPQSTLNAPPELAPQLPLPQELKSRGQDVIGGYLSLPRPMTASAIRVDVLEMAQAHEHRG